MKNSVLHVVSFNNINNIELILEIIIEIKCEELIEYGGLM